MSTHIRKTNGEPSDNLSDCWIEELPAELQKRATMDQSQSSSITHKYLEAALVADDDVARLHGDDTFRYLLLLGHMVSWVAPQCGSNESEGWMIDYLSERGHLFLRSRAPQRNV